MPDFAYIARDTSGQRVTGSVAATSEREVLSILSGKSLFPISVTVEKAQSQPAQPQAGQRPVDGHDVQPAGFLAAQRRAAVAFDSRACAIRPPTRGSARCWTTSTAASKTARRWAKR